MRDAFLEKRNRLILGNPGGSGGSKEYGHHLMFRKAKFKAPDA